MNFGFSVLSMSKFLTSLISAIFFSLPLLALESDVIKVVGDLRRNPDSAAAASAVAQYMNDWQNTKTEERGGLEVVTTFRNGDSRQYVLEQINRIEIAGEARRVISAALIENSGKFLAPSRFYRGIPGADVGSVAMPNNSYRRTNLRITELYFQAMRNFRAYSPEVFEQAFKMLNATYREFTDSHAQGFHPTELRRAEFDLLQVYARDMVLDFVNFLPSLTADELQKYRDRVRSPLSTLLVTPDSLQNSQIGQIKLFQALKLDVLPTQPSEKRYAMNSLSRALETVLDEIELGKLNSFKWRSELGFLFDLIAQVPNRATHLGTKLEGYENLRAVLSAKTYKSIFQRLQNLGFKDAIDTARSRVGLPKLSESNNWLAALLSACGLRKPTHK